MSVVTKTFKRFPNAYAQILYWAKDYRHCIGLCNQNKQFPLGGFPEIIAVNQNSPIHNLDNININKEYFGFVNYDYKNEIENLTSKNEKYINLPLLAFFEPEIKFEFSDTHISITSENPENILQNVLKTKLTNFSRNNLKPVIELTNKEQYINSVKNLIKHIKEGNIYEINYCITFEHKTEYFNPLATFLELKNNTNTPFVSFLKYENQYVLCASPERFFKKEGQTIISQPIKGTKKHSNLNIIESEINQLKYSTKEQNENVMIVDLVRNDLSKICEAGTVQVDELFGVYHFGNLYQMISTISGKLTDNRTIKDIFYALFPMGSMTGAPKFSSLQLIEKYENFSRNIYSGTIGYIKKNGDCDFNVVIRSIFYNNDTNTVSYSIGSGITAMSDPENEYEECMLKAENIRKILGN